MSAVKPMNPDKRIDGYWKQNGTLGIRLTAAQARRCRHKHNHQLTEHDQGFAVDEKGRPTPRRTRRG